jgi:hypothetical protein
MPISIVTTVLRAQCQGTLAMHGDGSARLRLYQDTLTSTPDVIFGDRDLGIAPASGRPPVCPRPTHTRRLDLGSGSAAAVRHSAR